MASIISGTQRTSRRHRSPQCFKELNLIPGQIDCHTWELSGQRSYPVGFVQVIHVDRPNGALIAAAVLVYISPIFFACSLNEFICAFMNSV